MQSWDELAGAPSLQAEQASWMMHDMAGCRGVGKGSTLVLLSNVWGQMMHDICSSTAKGWETQVG